VLIGLALIAFVRGPLEAAGPTTGGGAYVEVPPAAGGAEAANEAPDFAALERRLREAEDSLKKLQAEAEAEDAKKRTVPSIQLRGQVQGDVAFFAQGEANRAVVGDAQDGAVLRRARFTTRGEVYERFTYALGVDFAFAGRPTMLDVFAGAHDVPVLGEVQFGHMFEPLSIERITRNRAMTFLERATHTMLAPGRNFGVEARRTFLDESITLRYGLFRTFSDDFGDDVGDVGWAATVRATTLLWWQEAEEDPCRGRWLGHLGAGYSARQSDDGLLRFSTTPEIRLGSVGIGQAPAFVDTGPFAAGPWQLANIETAVIHGPWSFVAEGIVAPIEAEDLGDPVLYGHHAAVTYALTGESRGYDRTAGTLDQLRPARNFLSRDGFGSGPGAWEVAARYSYVTANSRGLAGGELADVTVALNWYLNPALRIGVNYIHAELDRDGVTSTAQIVGFRTDVEF
jgi:phosphate-selective porin OprO/OprP